MADEHIYLWRTGHEHDTDELRSFTDCREIVVIKPPGSAGRCRIVFAEGPDRIVGDSTYLHAGAAIRISDDAYLNLNRPGVARALLDEALAQGWDSVGDAVFDGWELLDGALARLTVGGG